MSFFSKTNVMIHFFPKTSSSFSKRRQCFGKNILKIITSVPGHTDWGGRRFKELLKLNIFLIRFAHELFLISTTRKKQEGHCKQVDSGFTCVTSNRGYQNCINFMPLAI
jgi:hypothetical protein